ncbi:MAG: SGNH/GDSL hydrolase family protein [Reyranellales bacterium]
MKIRYVAVPLLVLLLFCGTAQAFEIYALGSSATNCAGVDRDKIYPAKLQEILRGHGLEATVVNGGIDGDRPVWMFRRLPAAINANTRLVIFEPGPNDPDRKYAVEYAEKTLAFLRERIMPTIYISNPRMQNLSEAAATAQKYGAYYFGSYAQGIPVDREHWQFDNDKSFGGTGKGAGGHLTAAGCLIVAQRMAPLVEKVVVEKGIAAPR